MIWVVLMLPYVVSLSARGPAAVEQKRYVYDGWNCGYRYSRGESKELPAILLVHPVGIGMSSWFHSRLIESLQKRLAGRAPEVFAPDLIGCGKSDPWEPSKRGLFLPLDYVRQCEELWRQQIQRPCVVVTQGGLAPVGVALASRQVETFDGHKAVERLALCSPPTFQAMASGIPRNTVENNYNLWTSPLGRFGYDLLRNSGPVHFFSNLFLFAQKDNIDQTWLQNCCSEAAQPHAEWPVFAFNAGIVNQRGLYDELCSMPQPLMLLEGEKDAQRAKARDGFFDCVSDCRRTTLPNTLNVLPWEDPDATANAIADFMGVSS